MSLQNRAGEEPAPCPPDKLLETIAPMRGSIAYKWLCSLRDAVGLDPFRRSSYAQEGEDLVLAAYFEGDTRPGFYVDVGALHPVRFSNTYYFYRLGWRGINIEPRKGAKNEFDCKRPRDINLECGVADKPGELEYHEFNEPALNSFTRIQPDNLGLKSPYQRTGVSRVKVLPLCDILSSHLPADQPISFFSIDAEGLDLKVLASNDWSRFRPRLIAIEDDDAKTLDDCSGTAIGLFLKDKGYQAMSKTPRTVIFEQRT